ncbi:MAG TPA: L-histidine N(alpha)-methyltransferase [Terracidiphilus sp.]|nr:L-histidine N(alpha)-methyltransferase [Terracidiphilus sp.]
MGYSTSFIIRETEIAEQVAAAVRAGLTAEPKRLPSWLFYDEPGSRLFEQITELEEYYLTRTERGIFLDFLDEILGAASQGHRLRIAELGAGSAEKTRLLLAGALERQGEVVYEPVDVSRTALEAARKRIARELPGVTVRPRVADYTRGLELDEAEEDERRLVLYIGSSIGNFEPEDAAALLRGVRAGLREGDGLLLGVDLVKEEPVLVAAYDDTQGVTAAFNRNVLERVNRELGGDFDAEAFAHVAVWNAELGRMEMHLESLRRQTVTVEALGLEVEFGAGERMHTENSYKYRRGEAEAMLRAAGFEPAGTWTDERGWFAVSLGRV